MFAYVQVNEKSSNALLLLCAEVEPLSFGTILRWNVVRYKRECVRVCMPCEITIEHDILHLIPATINNQFTTQI